jgi:hypothetical protein
MDDATLSRWLVLREQADRRARSGAIADAVVADVMNEAPVRVLDLATGAGSNLRHLIETLPPRQSWLVVDRSPVLLTALVDRTHDWATSHGYRFAPANDGFALRGDLLDCHIDVQCRDLGTLKEPSLFEGRHLVTASALLDLVAAGWLHTLAAHCRATGALALFTMTYDGRSSCEPPEPEDDIALDLLNRHQGRDKGLGGPAAGPTATREARVAFEREGYTVRVERSDWALGPDEPEMQRMLVDGWLQAAVEMAPGLVETLADWHRRRVAHIDAGRSGIVVGHQDLAATLR